jgi:beta-lactamase regulating signal transducer with metallopeptidase domain
MILVILNHLWQSTLCLGLIAVLALLLRRNGAHARYWLWFAASMKFLVPFAALVAIGQQMAPGAAAPIPTPAAVVAQRVTVPFTAAAAAPIRATPPVGATQPVPWGGIAFAVWALGAFVLLFRWTMSWRDLRKLIRDSQPLPMALPVPVRSSSSTLEPGLLGILRPILMLPQGLAEQLSGEEIRSILAHELCHLRRRDNLTYGIHLLAQTIFWFYPPVWWLGTRLIRERERACDEDVLAAGHEPRVYAQSILKVCRFYVGAPIVGAAAVSRHDLSGRVRHIIGGPRAAPLSIAQKLLVGVSAASVLALPVSLGLLLSPEAEAGAGTATAYSPPPGAAHEDYLQSRPQTEVALDPKDFDRLQGYYAFAQMYFAHVFRTKDRYFIKLTDQAPREIFPESPTKFFATLVALQVSFVSDASGQVTGLVLHQDGFLRPARSVAPSAAVAAEAKLQARVKEDVPSPGTEAVLRRMIDGWEQGQPDYQDMGPVLAYANYLNRAKVHALMQKLGPLKSVEFETVAPNGWDVYDATFAHGRTRLNITPLAFSPNGKVVAGYFSALP